MRVSRTSDSTPLAHNLCKRGLLAALHGPCNAHCLQGCCPASSSASGQPAQPLPAGMSCWPASHMMPWTQSRLAVTFVLGTSTRAMWQAISQTWCMPCSGQTVWPAVIPEMPLLSRHR